MKRKPVSNNTNTKKSIRRDRVWQNVASGFGGSKDPQVRTFFGTGAPLDRALIEDLYRYDWASRRIIEAFPEDATREWIEFITEDKDVRKDVTSKMEDLKAQSKFEEALVLARLYGGSIIVVGADDGQDPEEPLNLEKVKSVNFLHVFDRWQLHIDSVFSDPLEANFGEPEFYVVYPQTTRGTTTVSGTGQKIHSSRTIKFDGITLPTRLKVGNAGWEDSVLTLLHNALKNFGTSIHAGAVLVQDFITKVLKIEDLGELLGTEDGVNKLNDRIAFAASSMSSIGISVVGSGEEFNKIQTPIAGLPKLMEIYIDILSAASGIPRARFFGQQLGVLAGATETTRAYYDLIGAYQVKKMTGPINQLLTIILNSDDVISEEPEDWGFEYKPLWQDDQKTTIETRKLQAETDDIYIQSGVLDPEEVAASRFTDEGYSYETTTDDDLRAEVGEPEPFEEEEIEEEGIEE